MKLWIAALSEKPSVSLTAPILTRTDHPVMPAQRYLPNGVDELRLPCASARYSRAAERRGFAEAS